MRSEKDILLLGVSNTGKTVFGAQLFGRIQHGQSRLRAVAAPSDIRVLEEALTALEHGALPEHTTVTQYGEVVFPILDPEGRSVDVIWPDYAGEQLSRVVRDRVVPSAWAARLREADGWLLMVRPKIARQAVDGLRDPSPTTRGGEARPTEPREIVLPTQVEQVELLQILLEVRGGSRRARRTAPRLAVVLSCLDEVETGDSTPAEILGAHLPLLAEFIDTTWQEGAWRAFGLSALGTSLLPGDKSGREAFLDHGPIRSGYLLAPDGTHSEDLTLPVAWLLEAAPC